MDYLEKIAAYKKKEIDALIQAVNSNPAHPLHAILKEERKPTGHFSSALKGADLAVIGEVKRRSPSKGDMAEIEDPLALALTYSQGGVSAISVLTDSRSFGGSLSDLQRVSQGQAVPTLRKDFIMHPLQLAEAVFAGASAALLIVRLIGKDLKTFIKAASRLGLETLTEIHDREELELALEAEAPIIGVNHRNLNTFEMDLGLSEELRPLIPSHVIAVAESGIHTPEDAKKMRDLGYDAILVGEALVRAKDPSALIRQMKGGDHES